MITRLLPTSLLAAFCLAPALLAQGLTITPCGGAIGKNVDYKISGGKVNTNILLVTSVFRADLSLTWLDPNETRRLGVALDLPELLLFAKLDANGALAFPFPVPAIPALAGIGMLHQAVTFPGTGAAVLDEISEVVVVPFEVGGSFVAQSKDMSVARSFATPIPLRDGKLMLVGGAKGTLLWQNAWKTTEVYDPATRSFAAGPAMVAPRSSHTQTRLKDGRYLLVGGVGSTNVPVKTCEIYDPGTHKFTAAASMVGVRTMHTATLLPNGKVLVAGGITDMSSGQTALTTQSRETELYDPTNNSWSPGPRMRSARGAHAAVDMGNGKILLVGGLSYRTIFFFRQPLILTACEIYDAGTNSLASTGSMVTTRAMPTAFRLPNGKVMIAGGLTGDITNGGIATDLVEIYNPTAGTWSAGPKLANKTAFATPIRLRDGRLAVIAGGANTVYWPYAKVTSEAYNPATGSWSALPALNTGRSAGTVFQLQACGLAVFGGGATNSGTAIASHELLIW